MRIQSATDHKQEGWMKFPTPLLKGPDTIIDAFLRVFKYGGYGGPAIVHLASCQWSRGGITYTSSMNLAKERVSSGVTSKFPDKQGYWVKIQLKADLIENARLAGDHICLKLSGGPPQSAVILSSELNRQQAPELMLDVKEAESTFGYGTSQVSGKSKNKIDKKVENYRERLQKKLTKKFTDEQLTINRKEVAAKKARVTSSGQAKLTALDNTAAANIENKVGAKVQAQVAAKTTAIQNAEKAKITAAIGKADVSGTEKAVLTAKLKAQGQAAVAKETAGIAEVVAAKVTGSVQAKERAKLEAKKQEVKAAIAKKASTAVNKGSQLTTSQRQTIKTKVGQHLPAEMAKYMKKRAGASASSATSTSKSNKSGNSLLRVSDEFLSEQEGVRELGSDE